MIADEKLVEAALQGSAAAFGNLVARYQQRLLRFLLTRCASYADAEDVLQDTFMNAYRYLHSYNPRWRFSTWIYRIAIHNAARQPSAEPLSTDVVAQEPGPLESCISQAERDNLWLTAQQIFSADAFSAMWLRYVEDMPVSEIARTLQKSLSWTKVTLMRSRRRLAKELSTEAAAEPHGELSG